MKRSYVIFLCCLISSSARSMDEGAAPTASEEGLVAQKIEVVDGDDNATPQPQQVVRRLSVTPTIVARDRDKARATAILTARRRTKAPSSATAQEAPPLPTDPILSRLATIQKLLADANLGQLTPLMQSNAENSYNLVGLDEAAAKRDEKIKKQLKEVAQKLEALSGACNSNHTSLLETIAAQRNANDAKLASLEGKLNTITEQQEHCARWTSYGTITGAVGLVAWFIYRFYKYVQTIDDEDDDIAPQDVVAMTREAQLINIRG